MKPGQTAFLLPVGWQQMSTLALDAMIREKQNALEHTEHRKTEVHQYFARRFRQQLALLQAERQRRDQSL